MMATGKGSRHVYWGYVACVMIGYA